MTTSAEWDARQSHLDALATRIQETGEAVDTPVYLAAAAQMLGIETFQLTYVHLDLYKLTIPLGDGP